MPTNFREIARQKAAKYGLLPEVFERQIGAESGFNPKAQSPAGALGIAQIMPTTAKGWGVNPLDPLAALDAAAKNMAGYVKTYLGGKHPTKETDPVRLRSAYEKALQAYNAGPGSVGRGIAEETKNYIQRIIGPDNFSFTEALKGAGGSGKSQQISALPTNQTVVIYETPQEEQAPGAQFLDTFLRNKPELQQTINPASLISQAQQIPSGAIYAAPGIRDWS